MRLLVFTQKIDSNDSVLGFFHTWIKEMGKVAESVSVICLEKGSYDLPKNVTVYSLGKNADSRGFGHRWTRIKYLVNLYRYLFLIRSSYDRVFVHMNEEYVLLVGLYWKLKNIPVYLWRNHPRGSLSTRIAVLLSAKVFCTSTESFVARFKKTKIMPVGNDTGVFKPVEGVVRKKYSVCMVGRIAPIKHIELALEAVNILVLSGAQISLTIAGSPSRKDIGYYNALKKYIIDKNLSAYVSLIGEAPLPQHPEIYSSHEICLNLTESGSFDKSIVGSASCGAIPLVSNTSLKGLLQEACLTEASPEAIARSIQPLFDPHIQMEIHDKLKIFVVSQSLDILMKKLLEEMK